MRPTALLKSHWTAGAAAAQAAASQLRVLFLPANSQEMCSGHAQHGSQAREVKPEQPAELQRQPHAAGAGATNRFGLPSLQTCPPLADWRTRLSTLPASPGTHGGTRCWVIAWSPAVPWPAAMQSARLPKQPPGLVLRCSTTQRFGLASYAPAGGLTSDRSGQPPPRDRPPAATAVGDHSGKRSPLSSRKTSDDLALDRIAEPRSTPVLATNKQGATVPFAGSF